MDYYKLIKEKRRNDVFKHVQCGEAHCMCCQKKILLFSTVEEEFWQHFSTQSHIEFLIQFFSGSQNQKIYNSDNSSNAIQNFKKRIDENVNINEKIKQLFILEKNRIAYCKFCDSTIVLNDTFIKEYYNHFKQPSHMEHIIGTSGEVAQFQRKYVKGYEEEEQTAYRDQNQKKTQQNFQFKKQMKQIEKETNHNIFQDELEHKSVFFSNLQTQDQDYKHSDQSNKNQKIMAKEQNQKLPLEPQSQKDKKLKIEQNSIPQVYAHSFQELVDKYFLQFIRDLVKDGFIQEMFCFILAKAGKVAQQICIIKLEEAAEELKIHLKNGQLDEKQVQFFVDYGKQRADQYLIKQPCSLQELDQLLEKAKQKLSQKIQDALYLQFLKNASIAQFTKQNKNLRSYQQENSQQKNNQKTNLAKISNSRMNIEGTNKKNNMYLTYY